MINLGHTDSAVTEAEAHTDLTRILRVIWQIFVEGAAAYGAAFHRYSGLDHPPVNSGGQPMSKFWREDRTAR
jgi:hypothetical protein